MDAKSRGIADPGTENRLANPAQPNDAELRRKDYRDAYRAGMISTYADEGLATQPISFLVIWARQASDGISGDWGPRTQYAHAVNLLTLYAHLLDRARVSARDRDGALLTKRQYTEELEPWTPERIKRVEDLREFQPDMIARWNSIVALGPPPEYDARRPWNGVRPPKLKLIEDRRPKPGIGRGAGVIEMPMGMYGVIRPGGVDARILYKLLKTEEMDPETNDGRKAILAAVIAQILEPKPDEAYCDEVADKMMKSQDGVSSRGIVYANDPAGFKKRQHTDEFNFEVGMTFLMHLDDASNGGVPMRVLRLLEPGIDVRKREARPLWEELYPNNTHLERAQWIWKRITDARKNWEPGSGRLMPGHFYDGYDMFFVAEGNFVGDQIWATKDARIFTVNEREAMIEAFRQGVMAAAGMCALAYIQIALALILVEGPAVLANIGRLITAPVEASRELLTYIAANPLKTLGTVALDQGVSFMLADDKEKFLEDFGGAETWLQVFLSLLMIKDLRKINLPSGGGKFVMVEKELVFVPTGQSIDMAAPAVTAKGPLVAGGESGKLTPETPPTRTAPVDTVPTPAKTTKPANAVADDGASVVIQTERKPTQPAGEQARPAPDSAADVPRKPPDSAADTPVKPPETAGDPPPNAIKDIERATTQEQKGVVEQEADLGKAAGDDGPQMTSRKATNDRQGGGNRHEAQEEPQRMEVADDAGGKKQTGGGSKKRGPAPKKAGAKKGSDGGRPDKTTEGESKNAPERKADKKPDKKAAKSPPSDPRAVNGNRGTGDEAATFTRDGIEYQTSMSAQSRRAYDEIPVGDTVVYTVHNQKGEIIYVGITEKTDTRGAIARLQEHLTTKDGVFIAEAREFRIRFNGDEKAAHALEQQIISTTPGTRTYNKDQIPWTTYTNYRESIAQRYPRESRGLVDDLNTGMTGPSRKPRGDWEGQVPPELDRPIRVEIKFNDGAGRIRGPGPDSGPGVHPDFDTPFDPRFDIE